MKITLQHHHLWNLAGLTLFAYVASRAALMSFTHDESLTYTMLRGDTWWVDTANNHVLNTWLTKGISRLFGYDEWALRLPNVLAFLPFFFFFRKITNRWQSCWQWLAAAGVLLNPFVLDFFSLCRGYGLAMAFGLCSLFAWLEALERGEHRWVGAALAAGVLCVYANYAFFTFFIAVQAVGLLLFYLPGQFRSLKWTLPMLVLSGVALLPALQHIRVLAKKNELYFGGETGIVQDTLKSLIVKTLYAIPIDKNGAVILLIAGVVLVSFVAGVFFLRREKNTPHFRFLWLVFAISMLLPVVLHHAFQFKYPIERGAIFLLLLFGLYLPSLLQVVLKNGGNSRLITALILSIFMAIPFLRSVNFTHTINWKYDAGTKAAVLFLAKETNGAPTRLGVNALFEPAVNYYRETRRLDWLAKATRDPMTPGSADFFYCFENETESLQPAGVVRQFRVSGALLIKAF